MVKLRSMLWSQTNIGASSPMEMSGTCGRCEMERN